MSDWRTLETCGSFVSGGTPATSVPAFWNGTIPWISAASLHGFDLSDSERRITPLAVSQGARLVPEGSVVFVIRGMSLKSEFRVGITSRQVAFGQDCKALLVADGVHGRFVAHALQASEGTVLKLVDEASHGTGRLDMGLVRNLALFVPPLPEQQRIAEILDTLDEAIRKTEQVIAKLQQVKQGLLHDLLTRGIDEHGELRDPDRHPEQFKDSELGRVPREWEVCFLDSVTQRGSGHTPSKSVASYWNGGIKWVSLADSHRLDNVYIYETDKEISDLGLANSSAVLHPAGTVILSRDAGIGKSAILASDMAVSQHFMAWRDAGRTAGMFLYYWMQYSKPSFENIAMGSTIKTIGLPFFKKLRIALPSREEQRESAKRLESHESANAVQVSELSKLRSAKSALMHDLLTGRVRTLP